MALPKRKAGASKAAPAKTASKEQEGITVTRIFTEEGELNQSGTETIEAVAIPEGAAVGRLNIMKGVGADFGKLKASVSITVPYVLGEEAAAAKYAAEKIDEILDEIGADVVEASADDGSGDDAGDSDDDADDDAGDDSGDDDGEDGEITEEDIEEMSRDQLIDFIGQYGTDAEEAGEDNPFEEFDEADYKKNKAGLASLKEYVIETLFAEGYTEEELDEMSDADLKAICKDNGIKWKNKKAAIKAILEAQEAEDGDDD